VDSGAYQVFGVSFSDIHVRELDKEGRSQHLKAGEILWHGICY
jgi:hypothetical protein